MSWARPAVCGGGQRFLKNFFASVLLQEGATSPGKLTAGCLGNPELQSPVTQEIQQALEKVETTKLFIKPALSVLVVTSLRCESAQCKGQP